MGRCRARERDVARVLHWRDDFELCTRIEYDFLYQFGIGEKTFYTGMDQHSRAGRTTLLQSVWSVTLSAMTVECE